MNNEPNIIPTEPQELYIVVDDNECNRIIIKHSLETFDRETIVLEAKDGREAVDLVKASIETGYTIKAIFMDLMMPVMDGDEAVMICKYVKEKTGKTVRQLGKPLVAMVTADNTYTGKIGGPCEGCDKCVRVVMHKPSNLTKLKELLKDIL